MSEKDQPSRPIPELVEYATQTLKYATQTLHRVNLIIDKIDEVWAGVEKQGYQQVDLSGKVAWWLPYIRFPLPK